MAFSVVIPVYNEEKIIERNTKRLVGFLDRMKTPYEIIIADNGSTDRTAEKAAKLASSRVRFISVNKKGAVGWAFRNAVLATRYDNIVSVDMDLSVDLNFIPRCVEQLKENSIVIGSKITGVQRRPMIRKFASAVFILMTRLLLGLKFSDYSMSAKGYKKADIIKAVKHVDKGSSYVIELIYFAKSSGLKIKEMPVSCNDMRKGKFGFVDEIFYRLRNLITLWFRNTLK